MRLTIATLAGLYSTLASNEFIILTPQMARINAENACKSYGWRLARLTGSNIHQVAKALVKSGFEAGWIDSFDGRRPKDNRGLLLKSTNTSCELDTVATVPECNVNDWEDVYTVICEAQIHDKGNNTRSLTSAKHRRKGGKLRSKTSRRSRSNRTNKCKPISEMNQIQKKSTRHSLNSKKGLMKKKSISYRNGSQNPIKKEKFGKVCMVLNDDNTVSLGKAVLIPHHVEELLKKTEAISRVPTNQKLELVKEGGESHRRCRRSRKLCRRCRMCRRNRRSSLSSASTTTTTTTTHTAKVMPLKFKPIK